MPNALPQWRDELEGSERERVRRWRIQEARRAGLDEWEAARFADGDGDIEGLRKASARGATPALLAKIFT